MSFSLYLQPTFSCLAAGLCVSAHVRVCMRACVCVCVCKVSAGAVTLAYVATVLHVFTEGLHTAVRPDFCGAGAGLCKADDSAATDCRP